VFEKKYEIIKERPLSISWEEYEKHIKEQYNNLLLKKPEDEKAFQHFFETYPCMLPGAFGLLGISGHYPYNATLITQPDLIGLTTKIPDFMWIACDSMTVYPVFVEIETPSKEWFVSSGKPSEKFHQAQNQLTDWDVWFSNPKHRLLFFDFYGVPSSFYERLSVVPLYLLIYGRSNEFQGKHEFNEKRKHLERKNEFYMTFDRLSPSYGARDILCSYVRHRKYYAKSVPATFELGPNLAEYYSSIYDKEKAVLKNDLISEKRKEFLIKRIPYWDDFGRKKDKGIMSTSDFE
jgi:hypothetical protein